MALALEAEKNGVTIKEGTEVFDLKEALLNGRKKDTWLTIVFWFLSKQSTHDKSMFILTTTSFRRTILGIKISDIER